MLPPKVMTSLPRSWSRFSRERRKKKSYLAFHPCALTSGRSSRSTMSLAFHPACAATAAYALVATLVEFSPDDCVVVVGLRPGVKDVGFFERNRKSIGAGGGSRTHMRKNPRRIFMPTAAFAAWTPRFATRATGLRSGLSLHRLPRSCRA